MLPTTVSDKRKKTCLRTIWTFRPDICIYSFMCVQLKQYSSRQNVGLYFPECYPRQGIWVAYLSADVDNGQISFYFSKLCVCAFMYSTTWVPQCVTECWFIRVPCFWCGNGTTSMLALYRHIVSYPLYVVSLSLWSADSVYQLQQLSSTNDSWPMTLTLITSSNSLPTTAYLKMSVSSEKHLKLLVSPWRHVAHQWHGEGFF